MITAVSNHDSPERASLEGIFGEIFKLISRGATREQSAERLRVPLEHAAGAGNMDLFNVLIDAGANGDAGWRDGRTLFDSVAKFIGGNAEVVSTLLAAGAQSGLIGKLDSSERPALYVATVCGHEDAARRLVKAGASVHFRHPQDDSLWVPSATLLRVTVKR